MEGLQNVSLVQVAPQHVLPEAASALKVEICEVKNDLLKWMITILLGQAALFAALVKLL